MADIKLADLLVTCPVCQGASAGHSMGGVVAPPVHVVPGQTPATHHGPCARCNNLGRVLTPSGKALQEFVQMMMQQKYN
jgi:hypothetical protein